MHLADSQRRVLRQLLQLIIPQIEAPQLMQQVHFYRQMLQIVVLEVDVDQIRTKQRRTQMKHICVRKGQICLVSGA